MTGQAASPLDLFQLHLGDADHVFLLSVAVWFSGHIDEEQLRIATDRAAAEMPVLTSRYIGDIRAGQFTAGTQPVPITITSRHPDRVMTTLSSWHEPLFRITICRNRTDTIVFSAAHLLTDARGLLTITARIAALFRGADRQQYRQTDRTLAPALGNFSAEQLQELFIREHERFPQALSDKKYFAGQTIPDAELTIVREQLAPETLAMLKTYAKSRGATIHDLLTAAYGTALLDWLAKKGTHLAITPLCSTADLRRYFPEEERTAPMNYTVAYWSPVSCGETFAETLAAVTAMTQNLKTHAIGIGAAEPFAGSTLLENATDRFAGVPFLTNPGVIGDTVNFGDELPIEDIEFQTACAGGSPFTAVAWTYRDILHLAAGPAENDQRTAAFILKRTADILRSVAKTAPASLSGTSGTPETV